MANAEAVLKAAWAVLRTKTNALAEFIVAWDRAYRDPTPVHLARLPAHPLLWGRGHSPVLTDAQRSWAWVLHLLQEFHVDATVGADGTSLATLKTTLAQQALPAVAIRALLGGTDDAKEVNLNWLAKDREAASQWLNVGKVPAHDRAAGETLALPVELKLALGEVLSKWETDHSNEDLRQRLAPFRASCPAPEGGTLAVLLDLPPCTDPLLVPLCTFLHQNSAWTDFLERRGLEARVALMAALVHPSAAAGLLDNPVTFQSVTAVADDVTATPYRSADEWRTRGLALKGGSSVVFHGESQRIFRGVPPISALHWLREQWATKDRAVILQELFLFDSVPTPSGTGTQVATGGLLVPRSITETYLPNYPGGWRVACASAQDNVSHLRNKMRGNRLILLIIGPAGSTTPSVQWADSLVDGDASSERKAGAQLVVTIPNDAVHLPVRQALARDYLFAEWSLDATFLARWYNTARAMANMALKPTELTAHMNSDQSGVVPPLAL